jgi:hypothetical protein
MIANLEKRTREYFEDEDHTPFDYAVEWIARGRTLVALAASISKDLNGGKDIGAIEISRSMLDKYLREGRDKADADRLLKSARKDGSHGLIEEGIQTLDDSSDDRDEINANNTRLSARERLAAVWNREEFAKNAGVQVNVSFASQHLNALRQRQVTASATISEQAEIETGPDVEVISEGN